MDISQPSILLSSLFISLVGFAMIIYGRKADRPIFLLSGLAMSVFPFIVHSLIAMWAVAGLCGGGAYAASRVG